MQQETYIRTICFSLVLILALVLFLFWGIPYLSASDKKNPSSTPELVEVTDFA